MMNDRPKGDELGALWEKDNGKGTFFTGNVLINGEKVKIVAFRNSHKTNANSPDYRILRSRPKAQAVDDAAF
jgi:uncharacterized protein (DUF736 family)